ncbi:SDR family NAD(P)-dependent oxidoreductase [Pelagibacterium halotolerans]|uniref:Y4eK n=1 Tax=Pelagibacterium halotolerans (strain DSM 22347 / JCM 15775 / CGMCC 1.7692 / B2) TaxID=1082931 RepID=G4RD27_PELHB|nr:SDR family NAD(P)-dependent oxidoreductase [Pelagibacterium halotolerans]AEQ53777.1 Y4eK [Pelagibacterium halotolerans B2]QJR20064.1 SDR family NAD(P)-dependent oxidoreductase [Pelagibacterium halotolerans]SEA80817.1 Short-chain dehydrogenase [Pelagibacterium halotolerans]
MKTAFVTGATRSIGRSLAVAFSETGWRVYAVGRNRQVLADLRADYGIEPLAFDMTDRVELRSLTDGLDIDLLVHAALRWPDAAGFGDLTEADIDMGLEVNFSAALHLTHDLMPQLIADGRSAVLFLAQDAGRDAGVLQVTLGGALEACAGALEREFGPAGLTARCLHIGAELSEAQARDIAEQIDARFHEDGASMPQPSSHRKDNIQ